MLVRTHILLTIALCAAACRGSAVVRDQVTVRRKVGPEVWRLEWRSPPLEACMPETDGHYLPLQWLRLRGEGHS